MPSRNVRGRRVYGGRRIRNNIVTLIHLEENRLYLLRASLGCKRPFQTLRIYGCSGLTAIQRQNLIQEFETRATLIAMQNKRSHIARLRRSVPPDENQEPDIAYIRKHRAKMEKKLSFLKACDETRFKEWPKKKLAHKQNSLVGFNNVLARKKAARNAKRHQRKRNKKISDLSERAKYALDEKLVLNFTEEIVPDASVALLSYDQGFIPSPPFVELQSKVDGYNVANKLAWKHKFLGAERESFVPVDLLKKPLTASCPDSGNRCINMLREELIDFNENFKPGQVHSNLNFFEKQGLTWLKVATKSGKIAITTADKGGATLIMYPRQIHQVVEQKLLDTVRFENLGNVDPTPRLRTNLIDLWKRAVCLDLVTPLQSEKTVGLKYSSGSFTLSTSEIYKPGVPYAYPLFKVHKLTEEQLRSKTIPPARLVSDLSLGITARSDKFIAWCWLGPLARDYATDLVKDSTQALQILDRLNGGGSIRNDMFGFNMDIVALYDSLDHALVFEAFDDAVDCHRPDWNRALKCWLKDSMQNSFHSAVLKNKQTWFLPKVGIPTGGSISVEVANIAVFFIMKKLLYTTALFESNFAFFIRFIDDTTGIWKGGIEEFENWFSDFRTTAVNRFGLDFTYNINGVSSHTQFLDIQYSFKDGLLMTDVYKKPTDANRFLHYKSFHPRHVFRSIVYSQAIRYRRIINDDDTLDERLAQLRTAFVSSAYPANLVDEVFIGVKNSPRNLAYRDRPQEPDGSNIIPWVTTYGPGHQEVRHKVAEINERLKDVRGHENTRIRVSHRRAHNLKALLFRRRALALPTPNPTVGPPETTPTIPCSSSENSRGGRKCMSCPLMSGFSEVKNNLRCARAEGGNCRSSMIIYAAQCIRCNFNNTYIGKTSIELRLRINGHRSAYYSILKTFERNNSNFQLITDDQNCLGAHIFNTHGSRNQKDFGSFFKFTILKHSTPTRLSFFEQKFIDTLKTLAPSGFNHIRAIAP